RQDHAQKRYLPDLLDDRRRRELGGVLEELSVEFVQGDTIAIERVDAIANKRAGVDALAEERAERKDRGPAALGHQLLGLLARLVHLDRDPTCLTQVSRDGDGPALELVRENRLHRRRSERSTAARRRHQESRGLPRRVAKVLVDQGHA